MLVSRFGSIFSSYFNEVILINNLFKRSSSRWYICMYEGLKKQKKQNRSATFFLLFSCGSAVTHPPGLLRPPLTKMAANNKCDRVTFSFEFLQWFNIPKILNLWADSSRLAGRLQRRNHSSPALDLVGFSLWKHKNRFQESFCVRFFFFKVEPDSYAKDIKRRCPAVLIPCEEKFHAMIVWKSPQRT